MVTVVEQMIRSYEAKTIFEQKNAIKEVIQELTLCGLSRAGFFKNAAFYGGTALRIFYGLDRFSEDLDFSLKESDKNFSITDFFPVLEKEMRSYGLKLNIEEKKKTEDSAVKSAFLKGNTKTHLLLFYPREATFSNVQGNEQIKVKFEVDTDPPEFASFEHNYRLHPIPYEVNLYDLPSLFAGKLHAVIGRSWRNRVKGRDLYDYVFYLSKGAKLNKRHLQERLIQSEHITRKDAFSVVEIKEILCKRFETIDYSQAKEDVIPFIRNPQAIELWSADFFQKITENYDF